MDISDGVHTDQSLRALTPAKDIVDGMLAIGVLARTPSSLGGATRVEHWATAATHARIAAATITQSVRSDQQRTAPTFWTDLYQHRIQVIGSPSDGEPDQAKPGGKGFAVDFHRAGRLVAAVAVNWPARLAIANREITASSNTLA